MSRITIANRQLEFFLDQARSTRPRAMMSRAEGLFLARRHGMKDEELARKLQLLSTEDLLEFSKLAGGLVRRDAGTFQIIADEYDRRKLPLLP